MAQVGTKKVFDEKLRSYIEQAYEDYGMKTAKKWFESVNAAIKSLSRFPEAHSPVGKKRNMMFRGIIIMKNFKMIYYYDEPKDQVWIIDIWDMRQNPKKLSISKYKI